MGKTEEEIKKEKRRKYLNEKMKSYEWYCSVCKNGENYTLKCYYDQILDIRFSYIFAHNWCVQDILPNFNLLRTTGLMFLLTFLFENLRSPLIFLVPSLG